MRVHLIRLLAVSGAVATAILTSRPIGPIAAQSLGAPTFTTAQQSAGDAIYEASCASCHGKNLDDGEFGPPLKGVEFRSAWFGRPAGRGVRQDRDDAAGAPGSLGAEKHANLLAYLMSQNQLVASTTPLPSDVDRLQDDVAAGRHGGPSGGLSPNAVLPPGRTVVNPLDRYTPVTDAMLQTPPAGEWPTWRRGSTARASARSSRSPRTTSATCARRGAGRCPTVRTRARRCFTTACCSSTPTATRCRRSTLRPAICCGSTRDACRWARPPASSVHRALRRQGLRGTSDTHIVALDAKTGRMVWDTPIADAKQGYGLTGGVTVAKGKVIASTTGRVAGRQFHRRARCPDRHGGVALRHDSQGRRVRREHLERCADEKRNGGSVWVPGSYDSTTGLLYIGVGQTYDTGPYRNPAAGRQRRSAVHGLDARHQSGHRQAGVALSASVERSVGLRLGVHAHADQADAGRRSARRHRRQAGRLRLSRREARASTRSRSISACRTSSPASIRRPAPNRLTRA